MVAASVKKDRRQPAFFLLARAPPVFPIQPFRNAHAAAFLLDSTTVVTALHAIRREALPKVAGHQSSLHRTCVHADLAILSLPKHIPHPNPIATTLAYPCSTRYTIHSPYAAPIEASLRRIDIVLVAYSGSLIPALTLSCSVPIPAGWSGSPVLDESSRVVGVLIQSRDCQCHAIPSQIIAYVHNHSSPDAEVGYILASEFDLKLRDSDVVHSINGNTVSPDGSINWGVPAPLQAAVFDAPRQTVDAEITRSGVNQVVGLQVSTAAQATAVRGRRGMCVVAGYYVMEAVSIELLELRYGFRWGGADLVQAVLREGDEVIVFVRDAGEDILFEEIRFVDGRPVTGLVDVVNGGVLRVGSRSVAVPRGKVRRCFVSEW